ncbi:MAG: molecular chaperone DnaK [Myxococcales bacterium]|nr:molecular chaperone DnaK [Myxococcales bacterium]
MGKIIGIDLGTTNSVVAVMEGSEPTVLPNSEGARTTPSMVAFTDGEELLVGQQAKRQAIINPERTVFGIKRLIGRKFRSHEVGDLGEIMPYQIVENVNGDAWISVKGMNYSPQEISAHILRKMKSTAEDYLGEEVTEAVITVPAYFDDAQRQATKEAGTIAGLNVRRIINEPTAAALSYGFHHQKNSRIAVFDLGGGTFDISVLEFTNGVFEVVATSGDNALGGEDFDRVLLMHLIDKFHEQTGIDVSGDKMALQRLREAAEAAKCELSSLTETNINLPFLAVNDDGPKHLSLMLGRSELNDLCYELVQRLEAPCLASLEDAGVMPDDIDEVLLVGGMTRMPIVQEKVREIFGRAPFKGVNPDEVVAAGAAIQSGILGGEVKEVVLLDVTPLSLGIRAAADRFVSIIPRNTSIPARASKVFTTTEDNQELVTIQVHQGESRSATDNRMLGTFNLTNIPRARAGTPRIQVTFDIDTDGIVNVSAMDMQTAQSQSIVVSGHSGLSQEELERAVSRTSAM